MGAKPFDKNDLSIEINTCNQPKMITFYIEYNAVIHNQVRRTKNRFQIYKMLK